MAEESGASPFTRAGPRQMPEPLTQYTVSVAAVLETQPLAGFERGLVDRVVDTVLLEDEPATVHP